MMARCTSFVSTTAKVAAKIAEPLALPAVQTAVTLGSYWSIQKTRGLPDDPVNPENPVKGEVKDGISATSSWVGAGAIGASALKYAGFVAEHWPHLTPAQRVTACVLPVVAAVGTGYLIANFGVEHTTLSTGLAAAGAVLTLNGVRAGLTFFAEKRTQYEAIPSASNSEVEVDVVNESSNNKFLT